MFNLFKKWFKKESRNQKNKTCCECCCKKEKNQIHSDKTNTSTCETYAGYCQHCSKELFSANYAGKFHSFVKKSAIGKDQIQYVICSCGFVNRFNTKTKELTPTGHSQKEMNHALKLFDQVGIRPNRTQL